MLRSISSSHVIRTSSLSSLRSLSTQKTKKSGGMSGASTVKINVIGLSNKCLKVPSTPVGPGAAKDKEYKNPEYFCYHTETFGEAEVELAKYRLPAPSNKVPFNKPK